MPERKLETLSEIALAVQSIDQTLTEKVKSDTRRREIDDSRHDELMKRVDAHGKRTTAVETRWEAFFGEQGAFRIVLRNIEEQGKKVDKLGWGMAIGTGLLIATQFWLSFAHR